MKIFHYLFKRDSNQNNAEKEEYGNQLKCIAPASLYCYNADNIKDINNAGR